jgi:hypothetical protein
MAIAGRRTRREKKLVSTDHRNNRYNEHTNTRTSVESIVTKLGGVKIKVDYYNKQVSMSETIVEFDVNDYGYLTNFNRIENLLITVKTEIPNTGTIEEIRGIGLISSEILPTIGDVFLATISGNTTALMGVQKVQRLSYNNLDIYEIEYSAIKLLLTNEAIDEFQSKMARGLLEQYVYDDEHQINNTTPIIGRKDLTTLNRIIYLNRRLTKIYLDKCYNASNETLLLVRDDKMILDPFLQDFIDKTIDVNSVPSIVQTMYRPVLPKENRISIFEVMMLDFELDRALPYLRFNKASNILKPVNRIDIILMNKSYGIIDIHNDGYFEKNPLENCTLVLPDGKQTLDFPIVQPITSTSSLFPNQFEDTYVMSPSFYSVLPDKICVPVEVLDPLVVNPSQPEPLPLTKMEELTLAYVNGESTHMEDLETLMIASEKLTYEESVYMLPLLLFISGSVIRHRADSF